MLGVSFAMLWYLFEVTALLDDIDHYANFIIYSCNAAIRTDYILMYCCLHYKVILFHCTKIIEVNNPTFIHLSSNFLSFPICSEFPEILHDT